MKKRPIIDRPLVFCDVETVSLDPFDGSVWSIYAERVNPDGTEETLDILVEHDQTLVAAQPEFFRDQYAIGWDPTKAFTREQAAGNLVGLFRDRATLVGANPTFDARHLSALLDAQDVDDPWHYRTLCVESMTMGYYEQPLFDKSGSLAACARHMGIDTRPYDLHTARGDTQLTRAIFNKIMR